MSVTKGSIRATSGSFDAIPDAVLFHLYPKSEYRDSNAIFIKEVMSRMANPKDVMQRATELRLKQGMTNSDAMKQAWAEAKAADAKAKAAG